MRWSGSAAMPSSSIVKCPAILSMVAASKRAGSYSIFPLSPASLSSMTSVRSNFAVPVSTSSGCVAKLPIRGGIGGTVSNANITWKRGFRLGSRPGSISATSLSNDRSWCAKAPRAASLTRASNSRKVGSPDRSPRITSVFTNTPIVPSTLGRFRPAMGVPTTRSSCLL